MNGNDEERGSKVEGVLEVSRTQADIRAEYLAQLWAQLDRLQAEEDAEHDAFIAAHPECAADPVYAPRREFMCDLFDESECEWKYVNTFRLWPPQGFVSDGRILELMQGPDVVWFGPSFAAEGNRVYIDVTVIDGCEG